MQSLQKNNNWPFLETGKYFFQFFRNFRGAITLQKNSIEHSYSTIFRTEELKSFLALVLLFSAAMVAAGTISGLSFNQNAFAVSSPPDATVTSPSNGATVSSGTVTITGTASSSSNTISTVQVSVDGAPYVTATGTTSWSYTATGLASGLHSITAKATDNQGLIGYSTNVVASSGVPVGNGGQELVYDPDNGNIYVANYNPSYNIVVVSGSTNHVLATISDSGGPTGIAYDSVNHYIYTANYDAGSVAIVNTANNQVVGSVPVGSHPFGVAYVPNGDVYVANTGSNTVSAIDPSTNTVVANISVGSHPQDFAYDSTNHLLYMTNQGSNSVSVIDPSTNTVTATIPVGVSPRGIAYDPANGDMYVANFNSNTVSIIDTSTNTVSSIPTGSPGGPNGVSFDPVNGFVYVPDFSSATTRLNVIDTSTNTFINPVTLPSASYYYYTIFDPVNSDIYITSGSNIAIVQTQTQFTVSLTSTSTSVVSSQNPSTFGQSVSFTATVTPSSATGNIVFTIDGVPQAPVGVSSGQAVFSSSSLSVGTHSITAAYSGDASDLSSTSSTLTQTVNKASTSVNLVSTVNPTTFGQPTTFTATINNTGTGSITFMDGSNTLSTVPLTGNSASYAATSLSIGSHSITAVYSGDTSFAGATSNTVSQTVTQITTTTTLQSSQNPSTVGQSVSFTATVSPTPTAGDTVTFYDGVTNIGTGTTNSTGQATFATSLSIGSHSITATFTGDSSFVASTSSTLTQTVNKITTAATLSSSSNTVNFGQQVSLNATVSPTVPNGEIITFYDGVTSIGTGTTSGGMATLVITLPSGTHSITASYPGDANDLSSTSSPVSVTVLSLLQEKQSVITSLQSLTAANHDDEQDLKQAIEAVQDSVNASLWQSDGIHLVVKKGDKVFDDEKQAVQQLKGIIDGKKESASFVATSQSGINTLVGVDQGIASVAISDANTTANGYTGNNTKDVKQDIAEAQAEITKASDEIGKGQFAAGIEHYGNAWKHAEDAIADTTNNHDDDNHQGNDDNHQGNDDNHNQEHH